MESYIKYEPKYGIDGETGNEKETFKTINERYPWFAIDFGQPRTVEKVILSVPTSIVSDVSPKNKKGNSRRSFSDISIHH